MTEEFKWNEHGVCTNPHTVRRVWTKPYLFVYNIRTAQTAEGWIFATYAGFRNNSGWGEPCSPCAKNGFFNTEAEAVQAAGAKIRRELLTHYRTGASPVDDTQYPLWTHEMLEQLDEDTQPKLF